MIELDSYTEDKVHACNYTDYITWELIAINPAWLKIKECSNYTNIQLMIDL